jgi:hypothetical protein
MNRDAADSLAAKVRAREEGGYSIRPAHRRSMSRCADPWPVSAGLPTSVAIGATSALSGNIPTSEQNSASLVVEHRAQVCPPDTFERRLEGLGLVAWLNVLADCLELRARRDPGHLASQMHGVS